MLFKARSAAVYGIDAHIIDVEVDFSGVKLDQETFSTVGLPDAAVRESPLPTATNRFKRDKTPHGRHAEADLNGRLRRYSAKVTLPAR